jgi:polyisoprenoid-binding protein YceI
MLEAHHRAAEATRQLTIDPARSRVTFRARYFGVLHARGVFEDVRGEIRTAGAEALASSSVAANVRLASLTTGIRLRDWHLRGSEYFAARAHPEASFRSTRVEAPAADASFVVRGILTLRGVARDIALHVREWSFGPATDGMRAHARVVIARSAFSVGWTHTLPWWDVRRYLIADEVEVMIDVDAVGDATVR